MANKKRRRPPQQQQRPPQQREDEPRAQRPPGGGANQARRERKAEAREARERARRRAQRRASTQRALVFLVVGTLGLGVFWFLNRAAGARDIPDGAKQAAEAADCSEVDSPADNPPSGQHLQPGQTTTYTQKPATSGVHSPSPYGPTPHVYTEPLDDETRAVHSLEHAQVIVYYRADGDGALPQPVIDRLGQVVDASTNSLLAPYPDLPAGQSLALTAWNKLQTCPPANADGTKLSPDAAASIAEGFIYAFACTGNAPEATAAGNGC
jgi:Protein of unknown function (DUF3105)